MHLQRPLSNAKSALDNFHLLLLLHASAGVVCAVLCVWEGVSYVCVCGLLCCLSAAAWQCQLPLPFTVNVLTLTVCFSRVSGERRPYLTYPVNKYLRGILWI